MMKTDMRRNRIPELDGLRVLMIAIVCWYHIFQQSWLFPGSGISRATQEWLHTYLGITGSFDWLAQTGYIWVDGTVLLSVFLLYLPWAEAKRTGAPVPDTGDFYYRRARRVIPAYYFIVLCHLLFIALPWKLYGNNMPLMVRDLATHLTFTFTGHAETLLYTQLGGAAWTLAILVQGYLLFPWIARGIRKHPVPVLAGMALVTLGYRAWCLWGLQDYSMVVNQLVNFLDVYVIGILCATGYDAARARQERKPAARRNRYIRESVMTVLFLAALYGLFRMLMVQSHFHGAELQARQMMHRPVFALCFAALIMTAPFTVLPLRKLLGNPVTRFLAGISMNFYLIHQTVAVHLKIRLNLPWTDGFIVSKLRELEKWIFQRRVENIYPNQFWEYEDWKLQYSWLCVIVALVMAIAVTYLIEKPGAKLFDRIREKMRTRKQDAEQILQPSDSARNDSDSIPDPADVSADKNNVRNPIVPDETQITDH